MPLFKGSEAYTDLNGLFDKGAILLEDRMGDVINLRESFKSLGKDCFKHHFYRFMKDKREERNKNRFLPTPSSK